MTHLGAAHRLRRRLARYPADADAVFVDGRVEHLDDELKDREPARVLRQEVLAREAALERGDGERALDVWRGLVSGRWSLVDVFENDGKRYVAAFRNQLEPRFTLALSRRQREVAELVGRGLTNGQIAYRMGLSESSVASHLQAARCALGVRSTMELVNVYRTLTHAARTRQHLCGVDVVRGAGVKGSSHLTAAELAVCELVGRGLSNQQIGQARNVSVRTVANQVASVLEKLGLRSRREIALL